MPRLPLRPPTILLKRHCPLWQTQSAPWMKTSISIGDALQSAVRFSRDSSRAATMRSKPCAARNRAASAPCPENWVLACSGMVGIFSRMSAAAPMSAMMSASAPASSRKAA